MTKLERYKLKIEIWNNRKENVKDDDAYNWCVWCEKQNLHWAIIHNDSYCYKCFMKSWKFTDKELIIEGKQKMTKKEENKNNIIKLPKYKKITIPKNKITIEEIKNKIKELKECQVLIFETSKKHYRIRRKNSFGLINTKTQKKLMYLFEALIFKKSKNNNDHFIDKHFFSRSKLINFIIDDYSGKNND